MFAYIIKRFLLIIPTLFGILLLNFIIVQAAPGGPVEQTIARIKGVDADAASRVGSGGAEVMGNISGASSHNSASGSDKYAGAQGIDPEIIEEIEKMYGFDKSPAERFMLMLKNYLTFDLGQSFYRDQKVIDLIADKLPVSVSLGLWTTLLIYLISIPLGVSKAVRDGSRFDTWTSTVIIIGYSIPSFLFGILLIVLFAGGSFWQIFPLRGIVSDDFATMTLWQKVGDYFWHITLPITAMVIGGFARLTMLTKNSFMDEVRKQYVQTAKAKGLARNQILYGHVFRNAMLIVISGFPKAFLAVFFTSSVLIEVLFSLDGLGLLGFEAVLYRDYPVMFGTLYCFTLLGLIFNLLGDITYVAVDPRIDFATRGA
jgi:microcin C transport system permease protein